MWGQVYCAGDKYSRQKAVDGLDRILPEEKQARMKAVAPLYETMPQGRVRRADRRAVQGLRAVTVATARRDARAA